MEKAAAGCPSLPSHYGLTNPGISRDLASRLPYLLVTVCEGTTFSARWGPVRYRCVSVRWSPPDVSSGQELSHYRRAG
jgi:hypothetical protein